MYIVQVLQIVLTRYTMWLYIFTFKGSQHHLLGAKNMIEVMN